MLGLATLAECRACDDSIRNHSAEIFHAGEKDKCCAAAIQSQKRSRSLICSSNFARW